MDVFQLRFRIESTTARSRNRSSHQQPDVPSEAGLLSVKSQKPKLADDDHDAKRGEKVFYDVVVEIEGQGSNKRERHKPQRVHPFSRPIHAKESNEE